eukprot:3020517-Rhodomonas_salina.4
MVRTPADDCCWQGQREHGKIEQTCDVRVVWSHGGMSSAGFCPDWSGKLVVVVVDFGFRF